MKNALVTLAALMALPAAAQAQVRVVDQSNPYIPPAVGNPAQVSVSFDRISPLGQTFTPTLTSINFATFDVTNNINPNSGSNGPVSFSASLYSGAANLSAATLIGTSQISTLAAGMSRTSLDFLFSNPLTLVPFQTYSLVVNDVSFANNPSYYDESAIYTGSDTYAGGGLIYGNSRYANDTYFSEGVIMASPSAVPEAASWAMMILGMGAIGFAMRRRQQVTTRVSYAA